MSPYPRPPQKPPLNMVVIQEVYWDWEGPDWWFGDREMRKASWGICSSPQILQPARVVLCQRLDVNVPSCRTSTSLPVSRWRAVACSQQLHREWCPWLLTRIFFHLHFIMETTRQRLIIHSNTGENNRSDSRRYSASLGGEEKVWGGGEGWRKITEQGEEEEGGTKS